jgi:NTP pyrophosphatase (non-canonical NTP hydrolase)
VEIGEFQRLMRETYGQRDRERGLERTFAWLVEEVGELSRALFRRGGEDALQVEVADVLAWLVSVADQAGIDVADAARRYADGCPKCGAIPCDCGLRG